MKSIQKCFIELYYIYLNAYSNDLLSLISDFLLTNKIFADKITRIICMINLHVTFTPLGRFNLAVYELITLQLERSGKFFCLIESRSKYKKGKG